MSKKKYRFIGRHATKVHIDLQGITVRYHDTDIVRVTPDKIILDTGGWFTSTTKNRMNQVSDEFNLGYYVYQRNYMWYVDYKGKVIPFIGDRVVLKR